MKLNNDHYLGFIIGVIVGVAISSTLLIGVLIASNYQPEKPFAQVRIERWNDDVQENVSVLNKGFTGDRDKLFEGTRLLLMFYNLNESRDYVIVSELVDDYTSSLGFRYHFSNKSVRNISVSINTNIQSINLCAYEYDFNLTTWEFYSYTMYLLIWIQLRWD